MNVQEFSISLKGGLEGLTGEGGGGGSGGNGLLSRDRKRIQKTIQQIEKALGKYFVKIIAL